MQPSWEEVPGPDPGKKMKKTNLLWGQPTTTSHQVRTLSLLPCLSFNVLREEFRSVTACFKRMLLSENIAASKLQTKAAAEAAAAGKNTDSL